VRQHKKGGGTESHAYSKFVASPVITPTLPSTAARPSSELVRVLGELRTSVSEGDIGLTNSWLDATSNKICDAILNNNTAIMAMQRSHLARAQRLIEDNGYPSITVALATPVLHTLSHMLERARTAVLAQHVRKRLDLEAAETRRQIMTLLVANTWSPLALIKAVDTDPALVLSALRELVTTELVVEVSDPANSHEVGNKRYRCA
jgi:hypothetical protein